MKTNKTSRLRNTLGICLLIMLSVSCSNSEHENVINIGFIGPMSGRAQVLGIWPAKALELAVAEYNANKEPEMPKVNLLIKDDAFDAQKALPLYIELKKNSDLDIVFVSNTGSTQAIAEQALKDDVIVINPLNNDELLNTLNENVFRIAKKTEEMAQIISLRLIDLGYKNVLCIHYENDFMSRVTHTIETDLKNEGIEVTTVSYNDKDTKFKSISDIKDAMAVDAIVLSGYTEIAYAMHELRKAGVEAPFYSINNTIPTPEFYENAGADAVGTEFAFFTCSDGNYFSANDFLRSCERTYGSEPPTIWTAMQAYDAMNITLDAIKSTKNKPVSEIYVENLKHYLHETKYHHGITGNIRITEDGSSRGIYFSLYSLDEQGEFTLVQR